ncbi:MAG: heavy metal sensor histidine kinase [Hyphomicrobium sp.]
MSSADPIANNSLVASCDTRALTAAAGQPLATRLIATFFSTAFLLVMAASAILYWGTVETLRYADDQVVDKRAGAVIDILQAAELNEGLLAHEVNEDNQGPRQIFIRVLSDYEAIRLETEGMAGVLRADQFPAPRAGGLLKPEHATVNLPDGRSYRVGSYRLPVTALPDIGPATVQVATDTTLDHDAIALFRRILFLVIGAALPLCAISAWYIVNRSLKPLGRITTAAQLIDSGKLDQRIALTNLPAELHELAAHFNSMLSRLEATWSDLRHYADTIAHEMRTPLNRMRLGCEIALDKAETEAELRDVLGSAVSECERLTRLLQGLLFLARVDSKQAAIAPVPIALAAHLDNIQDYFDAEAAEAGLRLNVACEPGLTVVGDAALLQQAIINLVSNAIAHSTRGGSVSITAARRGERVEIAVADSGEGISVEDRARIFDRFYRAGQSARTRTDSAGLGLGLSITKGIAELHGGQVSLTSELGAGTRVVITLPSERTATPKPISGASSAAPSQTQTPSQATAQAGAGHAPRDMRKARLQT